MGGRKRHLRCVKNSGDLLSPSPPAEKAASKDQTRQSLTGDGAAGFGESLLSMSSEGDTAF